MAKFSNRSKRRLKQCDERLQEIMNAAIEEYDFTVLCGHRGRIAQNRAYRNGASQLKFPQSKHNKKPSLAVDIAPYPVNWGNIQRFKDLSKIIKRIAKEKDIKITWGGDWKNFRDWPHWQV